MTQPWSFDGTARSGDFASHAVTLVEGSTFCISGPLGDIHSGAEQGLFVRDTRILSRWELTVDGLTPEPLSIRGEEPFASAFYSHVPPHSGRADSTILVIRRRYVGNGMREDLHIRNTATHPLTCTINLKIGVDFADLFEVKDGRAQHDHREVSHAIDGTAIRLARRRGEYEQAVLILAHTPAALTADTLRWQAAIPGRGEWNATIEVVAVFDGQPMTLHHPRGRAVEHTVPARNLREWRRRSPELRTADPNLAAVLSRSVEDLGALRITDPEHPERVVVAAGAPWFMALFGRDSLLTSWMLLPLDATLAIGTLQTLAAHQGRCVDDPSEEEPGRILHEMRFGPAARLALGGRNVYYGTADATALFVMLLGELRRWGLYDVQVRALLPNADRALQWIEHYGDRDGDGFVEYARKTDRGLLNQGWKDSFDGINFADGRIATPPIALAEVQGYAYAAYRARADLAQEYGDEGVAAHWRARAGQLKAAFNETFWMPGHGGFAVGLDAEKRQIDALTSNMGHCLWTGIVDDDKAESVADHLLSPEMFSGWGIRTLATTMTAYNPMSYHNGSVWPHDNALCVAGLMRYGYVDHAQRVAGAIIDAAAHFGNRLPELFCGFSRTEFSEPLPYPTSCSPQAWAAAAPLQLLRSMLRLDPHVPENKILCSPAVPDRYLPLSLIGVALARHHLTITVDHNKWELTGLEDSELEIALPPYPRTVTNP